jgi:uncharacterized protein YjaZ
MKIRPIDILAGLRTALEAPPSERDAVFDGRVMEPIRPMWEGWMRYVPRDPAAAPPSAIELARNFKFYHPALGVDRAIAALDELKAAGSWGACVGAMERAAEALAPESHGITSLPEVSFAFALADPDGMDPRMDLYTGVGNVPGTALVMCWPTAFNLPRLAACAVHELNHNVRFRYEPWSPAVTVGKYLVDEGVAECFAAEMYGEEMLGRWTTGHDTATIDALRPRYRDAIDVAGFDKIRSYIFGDGLMMQPGRDPVGIPDFAGYAIGYRMVRAFLDRTGMTAVEATYQPWRRIVEESGYLQ